jgi:hypothetical protein
MEIRLLGFRWNFFEILVVGPKTFQKIPPEGFSLHEISELLAGQHEGEKIGRIAEP